MNKTVIVDYEFEQCSTRRKLMPLFRSDKNSVKTLLPDNQRNLTVIQTTTFIGHETGFFHISTIPIISSKFIDSFLNYVANRQTDQGKNNNVLGESTVSESVGGVRPLCLTKFEADTSIRSKVIRGPKISKFGHVAQATPT